MSHDTAVDGFEDLWGWQVYLFRASDISWKKKQNLAGFSGGNSRKNRLILRDFHGKKSKFAKKSADFRDFPGKKVKIHVQIG